MLVLLIISKLRVPPGRRAPRSLPSCPGTALRWVLGDELLGRGEVSLRHADGSVSRTGPHAFSAPHIHPPTHPPTNPPEGATHARPPAILTVPTTLRVAAGAWHYTTLILRYGDETTRLDRLYIRVLLLRGKKRRNSYIPLGSTVAGAS